MRVLICVVLLLTMPATLMAQSALIRDDTVVGQAALDDIVRRHPMFSGSIAIAQHGDVTARKYTGFANRRAQTRVDERTLHSVASVGKMFTAVAIAQLVETGKLDYATPVVEILPELEDRLTPDITVDHLLHHTSGLGQVADVDEETEDALASNADYYALLLEREVGSSGPADFAYRNENYQVLGQIVATVSGEPYETYVREHIARPARMTGPLFERQDRANNPAIARNYLSVPFKTWWASSEPIRANSVDEFVHLAPPSTPSAGGGAYATATDMLRFAAALRNGTLLGKESFASMCELSKADAKKGSGYGRGCTVDIKPSGARFGHTGSTAGIQARFFMYPEQDVDVVVLSNHDEQAAPVFRDIDALVRGDDAPEEE